MDLVMVFKALGEETRLQIVEYLLFEKQNACDFTRCVGKDQTTISRHLKILVESGILKTERKGRNITYEIRGKKTKALLKKFGLKPSNACCVNVSEKE